MSLTRQFAPNLAVMVSLTLGSALAQPPQQPYPYPAPQQYPAQQPQYPQPQQYPQQQYPQQQEYPQQQQPQQQEDPDAPNHSAARISVMNGDVSVRRGDNGDYVAAVVNAPLVAGDRILTGPNGRAEVQFDAANVIRLAPNSEIRLAELAYGRFQIQMAHGMATFRVLHTSNADVEVSTPQASIRPRKEGAYRLLVRDDGQSEVTVRSGEVEVFSPRGAETLSAGKTMMMRGTTAEPEFQVVAANGEDDWDRWNRDRDRVVMRSVSGRYVPLDVYGTEDLDTNGRWVPDPSYGNVWAPTVPSGWAPYREGRWVWVDYYGWTWVSYDPWGWAPYHYGSWFMSPRFGWCWYPGGIGFGFHHYWSPARVGFVGFGVGIGWFPLGPREVFRPWWGGGYGGGRNVMIINNFSGYRNARITGGVTSVTREGFAGGAQGRAFTGDIRSASNFRGGLPGPTGRQSTSFSTRAAAPATIGRSAGNQTFYSTRQSTPVNRGSFGQSGGVNQSIGRPESSGPVSSSSQGGWRRFGEPNQGGSATANVSRGGGFGEPAARQAQGSPNRPSSPSNGGGWQRFDPSSTRQPSNFNGAPRSSGSVRISPPVVRERPSTSSPQSPRPSGGGGSRGGGGSHSDKGGGSHHGR